MWKWLVMTVFLMSCRTPFEPTEPYWQVDREPFRRDYEWSWQNCGSRVARRPDRRFEELSVWIIQGNTFRHPRHGELWGLQSRSRIYFTEVSVEYEWVRRHEMLHAQLKSNGHPPVFRTCRLMADQQNGDKTMNERLLGENYYE